MVRLKRRNESFRHDDKSRRKMMSERLSEEPFIDESLDEIEDYLKKICEYASNEDFSYYIDNIRDNLYRIRSVDRSVRYEIKDSISRALKACSDAVTAVARVEEEVGSASNELTYELKKKG